MQWPKLISWLPCLLILGCSEQHFPSVLATHPNIVADPTSSLTSLGHYQRAVRLQVTDDSLLGSIGKVALDPITQDILVADYRVQKRVIRFNPDGNYLTTHGAIGQGPGEYSGLIGFAPTDNGDLVLLGRSKIIVLNTEGKLLTETRTPLAPVDMIYHNGFIYVRVLSGSERSKFEMLQYNLDLNLQSRFHPMDPRLEYQPLLARHSLTAHSGQLFVAAALDNHLTSYNMQGKQATRYVLPSLNPDLGPSWLKAKKQGLSRQEQIDLVMSLHRPGYVFALQDEVFILETHRKQNFNRVGLLNPNTGQMRVFNHIRLIDPREHQNYLAMDYLVGSYERGIIGVCEDSQRFQTQKSSHAALEQVIFKQEDNPLLLFFQIEPTRQNGY